MAAASALAFLIAASVAASLAFFASRRYPWTFNSARLLLEIVAFGIRRPIMALKIHSYLDSKSIVSDIEIDCIQMLQNIVYLKIKLLIVKTRWHD